MRIILISDIHGNLTALDAVLEDAHRQGAVDLYLVLGDLVAIGPDPIGVLKRLSGLEQVHYTRGNTDRYVFSNERPPPTFDEVYRDRSRT